MLVSNSVFFTNHANPTTATKNAAKAPVKLMLEKTETTCVKKANTTAKTNTKK